MPSPPSIPSTIEAPTARTQPERGRAAPLVLIVDGDEDTLALYRESLEHRGYRTTGESDGPRALEAAFRLQPDAVLLDAEMLDVDSIETIRRIKADPRTRGCVVIVATGYRAAIFDEARAAGCDALFSKPFDPLALDPILHALSVPAWQSRPQALPGVVARCACGREFSRDQWRDLPLCGRMQLPQRGATIELRNCSCGSPLPVDLETLGDAGGRTAVSNAARQGVIEAERETVFLVDRDPHVRRLVQRVLTSTYAIEFIDDGPSALDRVRRSPPSALITEILIAGLDGLGLCRSLKSDPATRHVPILVFSMLSAGERARQAGADAFLDKPIEKKRLVASLRGLIEPRSRLRAFAPLEQRVS